MLLLFVFVFAEVINRKDTIFIICVLLSLFLYLLFHHSFLFLSLKHSLRPTRYCRKYIHRNMWEIVSTNISSFWVIREQTCIHISATYTILISFLITLRCHVYQDWWIPFKTETSARRYSSYFTTNFAKQFITKTVLTHRYNDVYMFIANAKESSLNTCYGPMVETVDTLFPVKRTD